MGTTQAMGMAEAVQDGLVGLRPALTYHLTANHFPPLPTAWVDGAAAAVQAASEGDWGKVIDLPAAGHFAAQSYSAGDLVERMHLWPFVEADDDEWRDLLS